MKIESVDFFYFSMPEIDDIGDGSQDAVLVRVRAGGYEGWGECEAAPLPTIAAYYCPMSHSACKPVRTSIEGMTIDTPADITRISETVHRNSFDLLQADHTLSGIDIALWDLLGKRLEAPVYQLLDYKTAYAKVPYASQLFGDRPEDTYQKAVTSRQSGFRAIKFGWGPIGRGSTAQDAAHFIAAREGLGPDAYLMVDAGTIWGKDVNAAKQRLASLQQVNVHWLEEPFTNMALDAYGSLSQHQPMVPLAAGEGCNNYMQGAAMLNHAGLKFIQIDTGRVGGITPASRLAVRAVQQGVTYVNHTFTSHLALSASLQPFAGLQDHLICEYPVEAKALATDMTLDKIRPNEKGEIQVPNLPGLGISINTEALKKYLVDTEIKVKEKTIYRTPIL